MTGLRREQSVTRTDVHKIEWDEANQLIKVNPLADWTHDDVWKYIREQQRALQRAARSRLSRASVRALHARGSAGEHERAGAGGGSIRKRRSAGCTSRRSKIGLVTSP
jgi:phosphoadenosine phosphosulfate reductase